MKRSSKLICGLLMSCLCFRGLNAAISVIQSPDNICVNEGEPAEIKCCWTKITNDSFNPKVAWFKDDTRVTETLMYQNDHIIHKTTSLNCCTLHFTNITPNDKGEYVCEVSQDIPTLRQFRGNKTTLDVATGPQGNNTQTVGNVGPTIQPSSTIKSQGHEISSLILYLSLAAAAILLTCCLVLVVCRVKYCKNSERVVIHQTPHSEGEEHENNEEQELSTDSSRGSLQWYQVPVYWSYFDVQSCQDQ